MSSVASCFGSRVGCDDGNDIHAEAPESEPDQLEDAVHELVPLTVVLWARVQTYGGEVTELLRRYDVLCGPYRDDKLPDDDLVHGDLNVGNLLVDNGRITGIVDIEAAGCGARAYDFVALAASAARDGAAAGVDELFLEAALRASGRAAVAVCAGAAFASVAEFVHERSTYSQERVNYGARRVLELLDA